jgi:REP element-mobilizing transposase RayT
MAFNKDIHHRKSIRLRGYDYSQSGAYFITICAHRRRPLFGDIVDGNMMLNAAGTMVEKCWRELVNKFPDIRLKEYVTMPNHIHGVVEIVGAPLVGALNTAHVGALNTAHYIPGAPTRGAPTVGDVVGAFKSLTTNAYIRGVNDAGWLPFDGRLWQRNYHEHIIRNEQAYANIAEYIRNNPLKWLDDTYFPEIAQGGIK